MRINKNIIKYNGGVKLILFELFALFQRGFIVNMKNFPNFDYNFKFKKA